MRNVLLAALALSTLSIALASAGDAGVAQAPPGIATPANVNQVLVDPVAFGEQLTNAIETHQWTVVAGLGLLVLAIVLMALGRKEPWLQSKVAHTAISCAVVALGIVGGSLAGGAHLSLGIVVAGITGSLVTTGVAASLLRFVAGSGFDIQGGVK